MKTAKDKHVVVSADFAGFPLKEAVKEHLMQRGWTVEDLTPSLDEAPMYQRAGFMLGAKIAEREFEKGLAFCGTGMGIHVAASKCPHVHAAVCESVPAALRCATGNGCNVLAMGAFFVAPKLGMAMADAFLDHSLGEGYEDWQGFDEYHQIGFEECDNFDYEAGVADVRLGMDGVPAGLTPWGGSVRAWRTDLRAGTTESGHGGNAGAEYSFGGQRGYIQPLQAIPGVFYAWASVIEDGRVVATDYAPDSGWLDTAGSIPAGTPAASPSQ